VLRRETLRQGGVPQSLRLSRDPPWPPIHRWQLFGIRAAGAGERAVRVEARAWTPEWLPEASSTPPAEAVFSEVRRRPFVSVAGDPCLRELGYSGYLSKGQRRAVRCMLTAPPGSTLIVNLPTGSGKSLCAHLPALLGTPPGTVVVVAPTTTLCIDQQRSLSDFIGHPTAHFGSGDDGEIVRAAIRERIREGTQRIVFAAPESFTGSLLSSLFAAASRGLIRLFAIDEAHLVAEWGTEFRSSFQELAGLRRGLLQHSTQPAFPTLLMSATLTERNLRQLLKLFAGPGEVRVVSEAQLRPEPSYWFSDCGQDEELRIARVFEAVRHIPRPAILYTTEVRHAQAWSERLKTDGFKRFEEVTGETSPNRRFEVMDAWRSGKVDLVVATSAFGLGIDQADVGAVIHACVPESIDRFYQEVGRGGRDGTASLSLMISAIADLDVAKRINTKIVIGVKRGLRRWRRLFETKELIDGGKYRVFTDVTPGFGRRHIDMRNDANQAWNIRTLTLLARSGLIDLDWAAPPTLATIDTQRRSPVGSALESKSRTSATGDTPGKHEIHAFAARSHARGRVRESIVRGGVRNKTRRSAATGDCCEILWWVPRVPPAEVRSICAHGVRSRIILEIRRYSRC